MSGSREQKKQSMQDASANVYWARCHEVHEWQRFYCMEPRTDSHLTVRYAAGQCGWPADVVARELLATDFVYKNTLYGELLEAFLRVVAARLRHEFSLSWRATWEIVRFYGPIALRLMCLDATGERIPNVPPYVAAVPAG